MVNLQDNLEGLKRLIPAAGGRTQCLAFMAARDGVGNSTVAREFAKMVSQRIDKGVLLIDLDFFGNGQFAAFSHDGFDNDQTPPFQIAPDGKTFWKIVTDKDADTPDAQSLLSVHKVQGHNVYVSCFHHKSLDDGQRVQVIHAPEYWQAMRSQVGLVIVDAPALEVSRAGLALVRAFDGAVVVVDDQGRHDPMVATLRDDIRARDGQCKGVVVNHFQPEPYAQAG